MILLIMVWKTPNDFKNLHHDFKYKGSKSTSIKNTLILKVINKLYHKHVHALCFSARYQHLSKKDFF